MRRKGGSETVPLEETRKRKRDGEGGGATVCGWLDLWNRIAATCQPETKAGQVTDARATKNTSLSYLHTPHPHWLIRQ
jgi:hypothetical protein